MCLSASLLACSSIPKKETDSSTFDIQIFADEDINLNLLNDPSPVRINVLQMKTVVEFNQMNALSPDGDYKKHLGDSVLDDISLLIRPKSSLEFKIPIKEASNYLGIVAAYRDLDNNWKFALYQQDKKWYQRGGEYLYLHVKADGIHQLSRKEAIKKILSEDLQKKGQSLTELGEEEKQKLSKDIERMMNKKKPADLKNGIFKPVETAQ